MTNFSEQEFDKHRNIFDILEITVEQAIGKSYQDLPNLAIKQYRKLQLVYHPDKKGNLNKSVKINIAYKELMDSIIFVDSAVSNRHLTANEFNYKKKLFEKLSINSEEVIGKTYKEIKFILKRKDEENIKEYDNIRAQWLRNGSLICTQPDKFSYLMERDEILAKKPAIKLLKYISTLKTDLNLIEIDKPLLELRIKN